MFKKIWNWIKKNLGIVIAFIGGIFSVIIFRSHSDRRAVGEDRERLRDIQENSDRRTEILEREKSRTEQERKQLESERERLTEERTDLERERKRLDFDTRNHQTRQGAIDDLGQVIEEVRKTKKTGKG